MKRVQGNPTGTGRFSRMARQVEDRFGHWPAWMKIVAGIPILLLLTALLMLCLSGVTDGLQALAAALRH